MSEIDRALVDHGTKRNAKKDVTGATNGNALGIDLVDGRHFAFATKKLGVLVSGVTFILKQRLLSPLEMHTRASQFTSGSTKHPAEWNKISGRRV